MAHLLTRIFVGTVGGLLIVVGTSLLFQSHDFAATNGIILGDNPSLLSEIRAPGALLMVSAGLGTIAWLRYRSTSSQ